MLRRKNFYCPKCGAKLGKRQIDRRFTASSFSVSCDRLTLTLNNAIAARKFPPELRDLAIKVTKWMFENHPDIDHTDLLWVACLFCQYSTFVAPTISEHPPFYAILPDSADYSRILKEYERGEKEDEPFKKSLIHPYRPGWRMSQFPRHQLVFEICLCVGCSVILLILFVVLILCGWVFISI